MDAAFDHRHVEVKVGTLPPCQLNPALLKQVFVKLIGNAIKFNPMAWSGMIELRPFWLDGEP